MRFTLRGRTCLAGHHTVLTNGRAIPQCQQAPNNIKMKSKMLLLLIMIALLSVAALANMLGGDRPRWTCAHCNHPGFKNKGVWKWHVMEFNGKCNAVYGEKNTQPKPTSRRVDKRPPEVEWVDLEAGLPTEDEELKQHSTDTELFRWVEPSPELLSLLVTLALTS